ncbi:MAG TPA: hypothetical protein VFP65_08420 [Anaeromyxobacteraceae bacterium]|nr:hypothetical protein [Anaeromyxobacteraceae bacterium]
MIPTWMIEQIERQRRERERELEQSQWERPQLHIELPVRPDDDGPAAPAGSAVIVIELLDASIVA